MDTLAWLLLLWILRTLYRVTTGRECYCSWPQPCAHERETR